ncbi:VanZ family protein [Cytobacillus gottheilii]|uniref:VanZ family protein n=1 Tax=Cytobacillus gottheilii TaxID=859144 RepID=UPI0009BC6E7D|nr:VanZ family protein [Cytobacillus gottheilii]
MFKKVIAVIPFFLLIINMVYSRFAYLFSESINSTHLFDIALNILPLSLFVMIDVCMRKKISIFKLIVLASFYVYIACVYYLTLFPLTLENFLTNSSLSRNVNLVPFNIFTDYHIFDEQIIGNFIMLFPFGIYLHVLYKRFTTNFKSLCLIFLTSILIEGIQLIFSAGTPDIDDIILNTLGGSLGYWCFSLGKLIAGKKIRSKSELFNIYSKS